MKTGLAALALALCATSLNAADFMHKASGLKFTLPEGWTCKEKKGRLEIENEDKTVAIVGGVIPKKSAKEIFKDIKKFLDSLDGFDDIEVASGPEKETVNGLEQAWYEGSAKVKDDDGEAEEIEWDLTIVTGGKGILFLVGIGKLEEDEDAYSEFFDSIEKAEAVSE